MINVRICTACGNPLESEEFYRKAKDKTDLTTECKKCKKLRSRLHYKNNKEQINKKYPNTYSKEHVRGDNPIDVLNKALERHGICWLDNLRKWHEQKFGRRAV